jgi:hypothetical protein
MVMSGMDPQMIGLDYNGYVGCGVSKWVLLGCGPVMVRLCDAIEVITLSS